MRERVAHERVEARLVDLDVEDGSASGRHLDGLDPFCGARDVGVRPGSVEDGADDVEVPLFVGPAATTQKRIVSPGSAVNGCVTYWFAYPLNVIQSAIWRAPWPCRAKPVLMPSSSGTTRWRRGRTPCRPSGSWFRLDDDRPVHAVRDVRKHRLRTAVVHVDTRVVRVEAELERLARHHVPEGDVGAILAAWKSIEWGWRRRSSASSRRSGPPGRARRARGPRGR